MSLQSPNREITLRFLAEPTDMNFGGKVHGGAVMKWIDQAGYACAVGWSGLKGPQKSAYRGARSGGATATAMIEPLARRIHDLGWHVQLLMPPDRLTAVDSMLRRLPTPIVFDHFGRLPGAAGPGHPGFEVIRALLDQGRAWVKLSGAYLLTQSGPPDYADVSILGKAFIKAAPERMLWGSDWPHVVASAGERPMPDDSCLLDLLLDWAPRDETRERILVENPARLYGFQRCPEPSTSA